MSVAFSPDSKLVVSGSDDETVRVWEAATGKEVQKLEGHSSDVTSVAFSPDSKLVVSGSDDKTVRVWEAATGKEVQKLKGHSESVTSVAFSPDSKLVVSGSRDKTVRVWETATGKKVQKLEGHSDDVPIFEHTWSSNSNRILQADGCCFDHNVDPMQQTVLEQLGGKTSKDSSLNV